MKTKPTQIDRSGAKWLPGAMALAATAASSQAATVQITLTGNKISSTGGDQFNADLTGDLNSDVVRGNFGMPAPDVGLQIDGLYCYAAYRAARSFPSPSPAQFIAAVGNNLQQGGIVGDGAPQFSPNITSVTNMFGVSFTDTRINGGTPTNGWLEVHAFNESASSHTIQLTRLIFDDESTTRPAFTSIPGAQSEWGVAAVPEPSGFAATSLLLGAAGLIRRRQAKAA